MQKGNIRDYTRTPLKKAKHDDDIIEVKRVDPSPAKLDHSLDEDRDDDDIDEIIPSPIRRRKFNETLEMPRHGSVIKKRYTISSPPMTRQLDSSDEDEIISDHFKIRKLNPIVDPIVKITHQGSENKSYTIYERTRVISNDDYSSQTKDTSLDPPEVEDLTSYSPIKHQYQRATASQSTSVQLLASDVDLASRTTLGCGRMLNDTIVHFYMNYLMERARPQVKQSINLFNSFFFSKFKKFYTEMPKNIENVKDVPPEFHETVQRWGRQIKVFEKDFLVFPVCDCEHWLLIVVAYANRVAPKDDALSRNEHVREQLYGFKSYQEPALLIFDSLRFRYLSSFTNPIRKLFLRLRWSQERPDEKPRDFDECYMREIPARVPRQVNSYDCGIHMLHSFEKFLKNPQEVYKNVRTAEDLSLEFKVDTRAKREMIASLLTSAGKPG